MASLDSNGMTLKVTMSLNSIKAGNIVVASNHIYNTGVATDTGSININMLGTMKETPIIGTPKLAMEKYCYTRNHRKI